MEVEWSGMESCGSCESNLKEIIKQAQTGKQSNSKRNHNEEETASQILCDHNALTESQFHHLGSHFMKPSEHHMAPLSKFSHLIPVQDCQMAKHRRGCTTDHTWLWCKLANNLL